MQRLNFYQASPQAFQAMMAMEEYARNSGIEHSLLHLVKLRASQINGCAYCVDMHTTDARKHGETERRLYAISVWRDTPFFTPRERAALAWTESLTKLSQTSSVPEAYFDELKEHFSDKEMVDLTMVVIAINGWNRLCVSFGSMPAA